MIEIEDANQEIKGQDSKLEEINEEIDQECTRKASLQLYKEKLLVRKYQIEGMPELEQDIVTLSKIDFDLQQTELEIDEYARRVETLAETQDYHNTKISEVRKQVIEKNMAFASSLGKQNLQSKEGVKALVDCFFEILREASVQLRVTQLDYDKLFQSFEQLKEDHNEQEKILEANERYFQAKMQNIEDEFMRKESQLNQLIEEARVESSGA